MILIHVRFEFVVKESDSKNNLQHVLVNAFATKPTYGWGEGCDLFIEYSLYKHQILHPEKTFSNKNTSKSPTTRVIYFAPDTQKCIFGHFFWGLNTLAPMKKNVFWGPPILLDSFPVGFFGCKAAEAQHLTVCHGGQTFHQGDDGMLSKDLTVRQPRKDFFGGHRKVLKCIYMCHGSSYQTLRYSQY